MKQPGQKEVYTTIIVLALAALAIQFFFHFKYGDEIAGTLLILALISYTVAKWIAIGWLKFSEIIGGVSSKVILSVVFFVFLVPLAFLSRLTNRDSLKLKNKPGPEETYFDPRNHKYKSDDFKHTF